MKKELPLGMTLKPMGWPVMAQAFIDFALWSIAEKGFIEDFEMETGLAFNPPRNAIDAAIDEENGHTKDMMGQYLDWLAVAHWGLDT